MREIKFRGISKETKKFVYSCNCIFKDVKPETIGQYIGLKDINNQEIYEGDIVHHAFPKNPM